MKAVIPILAALILAGCATAPVPDPVVVTKTVNVPVAVKCAVDVPVPTFVDTDAAIKAAPDVFALSKLYVVGRLQHIGYEAQLTAAIKGCTG